MIQVTPAMITFSLMKLKMASSTIDFRSATFSLMNRHRPATPSERKILKTSAACSSAATTGSPTILTARALKLA